MRLKVPGKGASRQGDIAYSPFDEIPGERSLREDGYIGLRLGVRRLLAGKKEAGTVEVGSTLVDAVAGLVIAF